MNKTSVKDLKTRCLDYKTYADLGFASVFLVFLSSALIVMAFAHHQDFCL